MFWFDGKPKYAPKNEDIRIPIQIIFSTFSIGNTMKRRHKKQNIGTIKP